MVCGTYTNNTVPFFAAPILEEVFKAVADEGKSRPNQFWRLNEDNSFPRTDLIETETSLNLYAELPGLKQSDINVSIADGKLSITGSFPQPADYEAEGSTVKLRGRRFGEFKRVVTLPRGAKANHVTAVLKDGLLRINIAKPVEEPETVTIVSE